jgi:hypothetical protein
MNNKSKLWAVVVIDWKDSNVLSWCEDEATAKQIANRYDELALRAAAVPEGSELIKETTE